MSNFNNYDLAELASSYGGVLDLADNLLPEMAQAMGYSFAGQPTIEALSGFIGHIGPGKFLQDNIGLVQERLGKTSNAVTVAADWVERSGALEPIEGRFIKPGDGIEFRGFGAAVFNTAVGRWQERRAKTLIDLRKRGMTIGQVIIFGGQRTMAETEHPEVLEIAKRKGALPTETDFARQYTGPMLEAHDLSTDIVAIESSNGDEIFRQGINLRQFLYDWAVLAVGNAPSAIQVAGQFRKAARSAGQDWDRFDGGGGQLFVVGDGIQVARHGESPATHQNPFTALGQVARNALMLHEQALTLAE